MTIGGTIRATGSLLLGSSSACRCVLADGSGEIDLLFHGRAAIGGLTAGTRCRAGGTVTVRGGRLAIWDPWYQAEPRAGVPGMRTRKQVAAQATALAS